MVLVEEHSSQSILQKPKHQLYLNQACSLKQVGDFHLATNEFSLLQVTVDPDTHIHYRHICYRNTHITALLGAPFGQ